MTTKQTNTVQFHMIAHHLSEPAMNSYVQRQDILTALATAAEMLRGKGKRKEVAADLERLIKELQKGE